MKIKNRLKNCEKPRLSSQVPANPKTSWTNENQWHDAQAKAIKHVSLETVSGDHMSRFESTSEGSLVGISRRFLRAVC